MLINIDLKINRRTFPISGNKFMDYKNDNRTPRDRITGEFLSELLFTEVGGENNTHCSAMPRYRSAEKNIAKVNTCQNHQSVPGNCVCKNSCNNRQNTVNYSLAMAYVKMQEFDDLFEPEAGFCEGTIFKALRFPFYATPCRREADFR